MASSTIDAQLLALFRERIVCTLDQLQAAFPQSRWTLLRALTRLDYLTSYNHNGIYYTIKHLARFDRHGLWAYHQTRFCRDACLADTLLRVIHESHTGYSVTQLEDLFAVGVNNHPRRLFIQGKLRRTKHGHHFCYLPAVAQNSATAASPLFA